MNNKLRAILAFGFSGIGAICASLAWIYDSIIPGLIAIPFCVLAVIMLKRIT